MKKKKILNIVMVLAIIVIMISGVMIVKSIKGSSLIGGTIESTSLVLNDKIGMVTIERNGIAYEVDSHSIIKNGDIIRTKIGSEISLYENNEVLMILGANTELKFNDIQTLDVEIYKGEVFIDKRKASKDIPIHINDITYTSYNALFSLTAYDASNTLFVYGGNVEALNKATNDKVSANAKQIINCVKDKNENIALNVRELVLNVLNEWQISCLQNCNIDNEVCFTNKEIDAEIKKREEEKRIAQQDKIESNVNNSDNNKTTTNNTSQDDSSSKKKCTIEIQCKTILDNKENLTKGKEKYVPSNGILLSKVSVTFEEGETVFDILKRVCKSNNIQLEYSWTPMYNNYYVEGINNLYEFDCGSESGWMYKVNGWFPNYGCSSYTLKDGDVIVWCYTCKGLGADVGGSPNY